MPENNRIVIKLHGSSGDSHAEPVSPKPSRKDDDYWTYDLLKQDRDDYQTIYDDLLEKHEALKKEHASLQADHIKIREASEELADLLVVEETKVRISDETVAAQMELIATLKNTEKTGS